MRNASSSGSRVPTSDVKTILRPIADRVQSDLNELGHEVTLSQSLELIASSFGFYKFQLMLRSQPRLHKQQKDSTEFSQFRPESVEARATKLLQTDSFRAMRLSALVVNRMRESGLGIDALEAFLRGDDSGRTVLSALGAGYDKFQVVNATVAMHVGLVPRLPADAPLVAPRPAHLGRVGLWAGVLRQLEEGNTHLWWWPVAGEANNISFSARDVYRPSPLGFGPDYKYGGTAELGFGFSLISEQPHVNRFGVRGTSYSIWTPQRHYRPDRGWWIEWHSDGWIHDPSQPGGLRRARLPFDIASLPVVSFCPVCRQIFAEGESGALAHQPHRH